jgi:MarR family
MVTAVSSCQYLETVMQSPLSQRPLGSADPLYVARPDAERALGRALALGLNVAVVGDAGTGKTTLVRTVLGAEPNPRRIVCVDGHGSLVSEIVDRIAEGFGWRRKQYRLEPKHEVTGALGSMIKHVPIEPDPARIDTDDLPFLASVIAEAPRVLEFAEFDGPWVCIIDTPPAGAIEELFGKHRERLWDLPVQWVLITHTNPLPAAANLFFETKVTVTELPVDLANKLVALRLSASGAVSRTDAVRLATTIASHVATRPRDLVAAARDAVLHDNGNAEERFKVQGQLTERAAAIGRGHAMLMAELISLGGAHASDAELRQRLGYSRPRMVQLLNELHDAGLVERRPEGRRVTFVPAKQVS